MIFRARHVGVGMHNMVGYEVLLDQAGYIRLQKTDGVQCTILEKVPLKIEVNNGYTVRVGAIGSEIKVFVDEASQPVIHVHDEAYTSGQVGLKADRAHMIFSHLTVAKPS